MQCECIQSKLKTSIFGENLFCFDEIDSTNRHLMNLARKGAPEGTVVITDYQKAGKGRMQRQWYAAHGENLLFSILLRPTRQVEEVQKITLAAANIILTAISEYFKSHQIVLPQVSVKWPNDILIGGKKVCGILAESSLNDKQINALVIGVGLNVNTSVAMMDKSIRDKATSLVEFANQPIELEDLLALILEHFEKAYMKLERNHYHGVITQWKKYCRQFNEPIIVHTADGDENAFFHDVNKNGYLIYRCLDGKLKELISGEITWVMHAHRN